MLGAGDHRQRVADVEFSNHVQVKLEAGNFKFRRGRAGDLKFRRGRAAALRLSNSTGKVLGDAGLGFEIVKLNTSVVCGGRTGNAIVGIDGEPLKSFAQSLKLIEFAGVHVDQTDLWSAIVTAASLRENTCIRLDIEREGYGGKGLEVGTGHRDLFAKGLLLHIFLEGKVGGSRVDVMQDEKRRVGGSLIVADARNNVVAVIMRRLPDAGVLVRVERTYQMVGAYGAVESSVLVEDNGSGSADDADNDVVIELGYSLPNHCKDFPRLLVEGLNRTQSVSIG